MKATRKIERERKIYDVHIMLAGTMILSWIVGFLVGNIYGAISSIRFPYQQPSWELMFGVAALTIIPIILTIVLMKKFRRAHRLPD